jgi:hypothetical protein
MALPLIQQPAVPSEEVIPLLFCRHICPHFKRVFDEGSSHNNQWLTADNSDLKAPIQTIACQKVTVKLGERVKKNQKAPLMVGLAMA